MAGACSHEGACHLDEAASEEERERAAGRRGRQAVLPGSVSPPRVPLRLVHEPVALAHREVRAARLQVGEDGLHPPETRRVDARLGKGHDQGLAVGPVDAGEADGEQAHLRGADDAQLAGDPVHRLADAPADGACRERHDPYARDDGGLVLEGGIDRLAVAVPVVLMPVDGHVALVAASAVGDQLRKFVPLFLRARNLLHHLCLRRSWAARACELMGGAPSSASLASGRCRAFRRGVWSQSCNVGRRAPWTRRALGARHPIARMPSGDGAALWAGRQPAYSS